MEKVIQTCYSDGNYLGEVKTFVGFLNEVNKNRACNTPGCQGVLAIISQRTTGLGGGQKMEIQ
jgi:hypothetical protein